MQPLYDPEAVKPMWQELQNVGVEPLTTPESVDEAVKKDGSTLIVVNSVCGCAAGGARPGVMKALQHSVIPDNLGTVFAGVDREAVQRAREHMSEVPPSSPCIALFKEGKPVFVLERFQIEQMNADMIAGALSQAFDKECSRQGPSIPPEEYEKINPVQKCGSSIPVFGQG